MDDFLGFIIGPWWNSGNSIVTGMQVPEEVVKAPPEQAKAREGVKTPRQMVFNTSPGLGSFYDDLGNVMGGGSRYPFDSDSTGNNMQATRRAMQTLASTYFNYRRLRCDGIVAIGRAMADALIGLNKWEYRPKDPNNEAQKEQAARIARMWENRGPMGSSNQGLPLRTFLLSDSCRAKDFGNHTMEVVYGEDEDGFTVITDFLQLLPETTRPLVLADTRSFVGVRNWGIHGGQIDLAPEYCVRFVYDAEGGNLFGRSRFENCKDWIVLKWEAREKIHTDFNIAIGNIMKVGFPVADDGNVETTTLNKQKADIIGSSLALGKNISFPTFSMKDQLALLQTGADIKDLEPWPIKRLDTGSNSFTGFKVAIDLLDEQILFGLLCLPRSVRESNYGSRADAEQHTDSMALMAWNWIVYVTGVAQLLTDIVLKQWGAKAGDVMVIPAPLDDQTVTILRNLLVAIISGDPSVGVKAIDLKPLFDKIGVPMREAFDQDAMVQEADDAKKAELAAGKGGGNEPPVKSTALRIRSNLTA